MKTFKVMLVRTRRDYAQFTVRAPDTETAQKRAKALAKGRAVVVSGEETVPFRDGDTTSVKILGRPHETGDELKGDEPEDEHAE